jgi:hypothetical protein
MMLPHTKSHMHQHASENTCTSWVHTLDLQSRAFSLTTQHSHYALSQPHSNTPTPQLKGLQTPLYPTLLKQRTCVNHSTYAAPFRPGRRPPPMINTAHISQAAAAMHIHVVHSPHVQRHLNCAIHYCCNPLLWCSCPQPAAHLCTANGHDGQQHSAASAHCA